MWPVINILLTHHKVVAEVNLCSAFGFQNNKKIFPQSFEVIHYFAKDGLFYILPVPTTLRLNRLLPSNL